MMARLSLRSHGGSCEPCRLSKSKSLALDLVLGQSQPNIMYVPPAAAVATAGRSKLKTGAVLCSAFCSSHCCSLVLTLLLLLGTFGTVCLTTAAVIAAAVAVTAAACSAVQC